MKTRSKSFFKDETAKPLDKNLLQKEEQLELKQKKDYEARVEKRKYRLMDPSESSNIVLDTELLLNTQEYDHHDFEKEQAKKKKDFHKQPGNVGKRVKVRAVEFDWVFNTKHGSKLIEILSLTKNIELFSIPVIQDIILY